MKKVDDRQLKELTGRLDILIRLVVLDKVEEKNVKEKVAYLMKAGFSATQISKLIKKPINTVTAYISRLKKAQNG